MNEENTVNITIGKNAPDYLKDLILSAIPDDAEVNLIDNHEQGETIHPTSDDAMMDSDSSSIAKDIRGDLLKHYSTGDLGAFIQYDHTGAPDGLSDSGMFSTVTSELRHCMMPVRVQILASIPHSEAISMLNELAEWVSSLDSEGYTQYAKQACTKLKKQKPSDSSIPF